MALDLGLIPCIDEACSEPAGDNLLPLLCIDAEDGGLLLAGDCEASDEYLEDNSPCEAGEDTGKQSDRLVWAVSISVWSLPVISRSAGTGVKK